MDTMTNLAACAKDLSILVVEDDKESNIQLTETLELFFKEVGSAYDGVEALELYKKKPYDIIISDVLMPNMTGTELFTHIKRISRMQPIILMSAHFQFNNVQKIVKVEKKPCVQMIQKPYDGEKLLELLVMMCKNMSEMEEFNIPKFKEKRKEIAPQQIQQPKSETTKSQELKPEVLYDYSTEITRLFELRDDFEVYIDLLYIYDIQTGYINEVNSILHKMYTILLQMEELKEMGIVIFELSSVLENIQVETLSPEEKKRLFVLEYIYDDISNYLEKVFNENVKNVHYLEDSLRSSVMQLKGETNTSSQEDSDDFELF